MNIFEEVKSRVTIQQAVEFLGLELTKLEHGKDGAQFRYPCPIGKAADKRDISVNHGKGFRCFTCDKRGDDATALVAHVHGIRNGEAAKILKDHFIASSSTEPARETAKAPGRSGSANAPATFNSSHPVIEMLGISPDLLEAIGGGFDGERIVLPIRTATGELKMTLGIATKVDQNPLLLFSETVEAKAAPDDLRKLFRIVG